MITARPKKPLSGRMDLTLDGDPIGQLRVRFLWGEGLLECEGVRYSIRHKGFFNTLLEAVDPDSGEVFATVRSRVMVTPVMVTKPIRGSRISCSRSSEIFCWMRLAICA